MSTLIVVLRTVSLLALLGPLLLRVGGGRTSAKARTRRRDGSRAPVVANLATFGLFFPALLLFAGSSDGPTALLLASSGSLVAIAGAVLVFRARTALGSAWSLVPLADRGTGLITTGPYRFVRHPIYLGLVLVAVGEAIAFGNWPALSIALGGAIPTFAWRARAEETILGRTFGDSYALYRKQTGMIIPRVL